MHILFKLSLASVFIAACGGHSETTVTQYVLQSTPVFCYPDTNIVPFIHAFSCANTRKSDDRYIRVSNMPKDRELNTVNGAKPEWGVRKKITVEEYRYSNGRSANFGGESIYTVKLLSIDEEIADPIGTRYTVSTFGIPTTEDEIGYYYFGSGGGQILGEQEIDTMVNTRRRFAIERISANEHWYKLDGYDQPIYCPESLCGSLKLGQRYYISEITHAPEVFELVEIDGKRAISIVQP